MPVKALYRLLLVRKSFDDSLAIQADLDDVSKLCVERDVHIEPCAYSLGRAFVSFCVAVFREKLKSRINRSLDRGSIKTVLILKILFTKNTSLQKYF